MYRSGRFLDGTCGEVMHCDGLVFPGAPGYNHRVTDAAGPRIYEKGGYNRRGADVVVTLPWEVTINDPTKFVGEGATADIPAGLMTPFHLGWRREVVYWHAQLHKCEIYYLTPKRKKIRSKKGTIQHFSNNPHNHLLEKFSVIKEAFSFSEFYM